MLQYEDNVFLLSQFRHCNSGSEFLSPVDHIYFSLPHPPGKQHHQVLYSTTKNCDWFTSVKWSVTDCTVRDTLSCIFLFSRNILFAVWLPPHRLRFSLPPANHLQIQVQNLMKLLSLSLLPVPWRIPQASLHVPGSSHPDHNRWCPEIPDSYLPVRFLRSVRFLPYSFSSLRRQISPLCIDCRTQTRRTASNDTYIIFHIVSSFTPIIPIELVCFITNIITPIISSVNK